MLLITQTDIAEAIDRTVNNAAFIVKGLPFTRRSTRRYYALPDVLPRLGRRHAHAHAALLTAAIDDGGTFMGDNGDLPNCLALESFLRTHVDGAELRIWQARNSYFEALSRAMRTGGLTGDVERQRLLLLREPSILRFIVTGDRASLPPQWEHFSRCFALLHSARVALPGDVVERVA